ncbi:MAG: deoxyribose-phosphate aldolase [Deltaproteobacteria bacterium]|nr:deoxyribose-phosphate aldolase [Deltaproteobacteria bacterium]
MMHVTVDQVGVEERARKLSTRSIKTSSKREGIKLIISMIDLTTLEGKDSPGKIRAMCQKAIRPLPGNADVPSVAAVCVYPNLIREAKRCLAGTNIKIASVATGFPSGQYPLDIKLADVRDAVTMGADEIDMVIDRGAFLAGKYRKVADEIAKVKEACGPAHLKVILETAELETFDNIRKASWIAMESGADFIKTSTGKLKEAATLPITLVMLEALRDYWYETGKVIGMKPAGGIRTSKDALRYLVLVKETVGDTWLTPDLFRFGASTLTNDLLMQLAKEMTGNYQAAEYFTID